MGLIELLYRVWRFGLQALWWDIKRAIQEFCAYIRWEWQRLRRGNDATH